MGVDIERISPGDGKLDFCLFCITFSWDFQNSTEIIGFHKFLFHDATSALVHI